MSTADVVELVGIILAFIATNIGHLVSAKNNNNKMMEAIEKQSTAADAAFDKAIAVYAAKTDAAIVELTREVREHNNFARRVPVLEEKVNSLERKVGV